MLWYTDLDCLIRKTAPQIRVVCVACDYNGQVGLTTAEHNLQVLLERPFACQLSEADAIITAAAQRGPKIEVAGQFHRRALERIKLKLMETRLFECAHT